MFIGRKKELALLSELTKKKSASLIVLRGRRRIGKSTLLEEFGQKYGDFIEIAGLAPRDGIDNVDQLDNFSEQLSSAINIPGFKFLNWTQAFEALAKIVADKKVFILLDEISWMASNDKDFVGKLKIAWDKFFSKNPKLILALCGSVSSWIDKNILKDTDFVGRISLDYKLGPLDIKDCMHFWGKNQISSMDKLKVLSITGGVPKYLVEMNPKMTAEQNIKKLCFNPEGYLFNDFQKIFNDIFDRRATNYKKILNAINLKKLSPKDLALKLNEAQNGDFSDYIKDLEDADFLERQYTWDLESGKVGKLSLLTIKDNYVRFFLKYIEPAQQKILKNIFEFQTLDELINWDSISGLLFENLIYANIHLILDKIGISSSEIIQYGSYFQNKTKNKEGCQVDLIVLCKRKNIYICEIKFRNKIHSSVEIDVQKKIEKLKIPKSFSVRPILIYSGELSADLAKSSYFIEKINFNDLLAS